MNNSNKWMPQPQMSMPPLGFGVVRPQPVRATGISNYGMPSEVPSSHTPINLTENSFSHWQYHHANMTQIPQQQQQQFMMAQQQKALEEQKALYERIMKQKQFNEQKQRLKEFGSRTKKTTVSADDMIQNIFEKQEQSAKNKNVKTYRGSSQSVAENIPKSNYYCPPQPPFIDQNHYHGLSQSQLPVNDSAVPNLLPVEKGKETSDPSFTKHTYAVNNLSLDQKFSYQGYNSLSNKSVKSANPEVLSGMNTVQFSANTNNSLPLESIVKQTPEVIPLELPPWLKDSSKLPELYSVAAGLVQSSDNEWVDTSRAYMLLMQTCVPPQYLGILWEMVNQHKPGQLKKTEFYALLALVACVQKGKTIRNTDVLKTLLEPVYPVINHPALLPLAEEKAPPPVNELSHIAPSNANSHHSTPQNITTFSDSDKKLTESTTTTTESLPDGDDFDDFVSAPVSSLKDNNPIPNFATFPPPLPSNKTIHLSPVNTNNAIQRTHETVKSNPVKNLPTLGNSPVNHPKLNEPVELSDDDFNDFQSAPSSIVISTAPCTDHSSSTKTDKMQAEEGTDKYAVFRDLVSSGKQTDSSLSEEDPVVTSNTQELRKDSTPKPIGENQLVKTHSSHVSDTDGADCFADFVSKTIPQYTDVSSESSNYITANASSETSNDDEDDFGDFVGSTSIDGINYHTKPVVQTVDIKSETQSVASLELPGLELTVNLGQSTAYNGSSKADGLISSSCISELELEHQLQSLELSHMQQNKESIIKDSLYEIDESLSSQIESQVEKYKTFSNFEPQIDRNPRVELWEKCLQGCKKLLEEGDTIASNLQEHSSVLEFVLATSQLKDYIKNLEEVWKVSQRIEAANNCGGQHSIITELAFSINQIWHSVCRSLGKQIDEVNDTNEFEKFNDTKGFDESNSCSLCLTANASLSYGGKFYHPQCANLWVNVVDSSLPSVSSSKTGLVNSKPTLL